VPSGCFSKEKGVNQKFVFCAPKARRKGMKQQPTLQTNRLILRPFELTDAKEVQRLAGDRALADTTLEIPHPYEEGIAEKWISTHRQKFENGEMVNVAIILLETEGLIGAMGLTIVPRFERAELGYWIGKPYWGNGYCTEAARAVLEYGFTTLKLNRIHAHHFKRNPASGRVLEKLGMVHEGFARQHVKKWDIFEDIVLYGILKSEWQNRCLSNKPNSNSFRHR
jgi:[ribosomal protein S5]-alanine N-acetyltransferase